MLRHESKCANLHGHNYVAEFYAEADALDSVGRVIDFSVLKEKLGGWIDKNWDHTFIVFREDADVISLLGQGRWNKPPYALPCNPTAENMARFLLDEICPTELRGTGVKVTKIRLYETENCWVDVE